MDVCADLFDQDGNPRTLFDGHSKHPLERQDASNILGYTLQPGARIIIPLGIAMTTSPDIYTRISPRSGLAIKQGLHILGGVVDCEYTGELGAICCNTDHSSPIVISHGMRIAQLVFERTWLGEPSLVESLKGTERGAGGFGSTGA